MYVFPDFEANGLAILILDYCDVLDLSNIIVNIIVNIHIVFASQEIRFIFTVHFYSKILRNTSLFTTLKRTHLFHCPAEGSVVGKAT